MLQKENMLLKDGLAQSEKELEEARGEIYKLQETPTDRALLIEERAKIGRMEKHLLLILEEPENIMSNGKAMREMLRQARIALEESK